MSAELDKQGASYSEGIISTDAKEILKRWQNENVEMELVQLTTAAGHAVLFAPPCYSDLQPIKLLWALDQRAVARKYKKGVTFTEVTNHLAE